MECLNEYANLLLAFFTFVLAGATVGLWRATTRYRKATERYANITEKQFAVNGMNHLERIFGTVHHGGLEMTYAIREAITGVKKEEQLTQDAQDELRYWFLRYYKGLLEQMKTHLEKEFPSGT